MNIYYKTGWCLLFMVSLMLAGMSANSSADNIYTVKKGDSLSRISKRFGTDIETISRANDLSPDKIAIGARLIIPSREPVTLPAQNDISQENVREKDAADDIALLESLARRSAEAGAVVYKVKRGDSLWKIAKKYSKTVSELRKLNHLTSGKLRPSQKLIIEPQPEVMRSTLPLITLKSQDNADGPDIGQSIDETLPVHNDIKEFLMFIAEKTIGIPYKFGGNSLKSTDCSGYVQKVFSFMGIQLPRSAREQFTQGVSVKKEDLSIGDLVFFRSYASFPSHVGIYLGNNLFIHASSYAKKVTIDSLNTSYFVKRFIGAKRLDGLDDLKLPDVEERLTSAVQ